MSLILCNFIPENNTDLWTPHVNHETKAVRTCVPVFPVTNRIQYVYRSGFLLGKIIKNV